MSQILWLRRAGLLAQKQQLISEKEIECSTLYSLRSEVAIPLTVVIATLCFSGNSLVIFIFSRSKKIAETKIFEIAVAVLDIAACVFLLPMYVLQMSSLGICRFELVIQFVKFSEGVFGPLAFTACYSLLVCVAIDRFCAVFYPLKFKIFCFSGNFYSLTNRRKPS